MDAALVEALEDAKRLQADADIRSASAQAEDVQLKEALASSAQRLAEPDFRRPKSSAGVVISLLDSIAAFCVKKCMTCSLKRTNR